MNAAILSVSRLMLADTIQSLHAFRLAAACIRAALQGIWHCLSKRHKLPVFSISLNKWLLSCDSCLSTHQCHLDLDTSWVGYPSLIWYQKFLPSTVKSIPIASSGNQVESSLLQPSLIYHQTTPAWLNLLAHPTLCTWWTSGPNQFFHALQVWFRAALQIQRARTLRLTREW